MPVTRDQLDVICAALPGAVSTQPPELDSWKVGDKMFATFGVKDGVKGVSVKTDSVETATMLIDASTAVHAPYFHKSWVRLPLADTTTDEATHRLNTSYDIIRKSLKKVARDAIPQREDS